MEKEIKRKRDPSESICGQGINPPPSNGKKTKGRVKIKTEFIENKLRRYTTFSKRKTGIMKKAHELSILTGTQVMLLVASETGHVYTFATKKLQPMITSEAGKALIKTCLNSPDKGEGGKEEGDQRMCAEGFEETEIVYEVENKDKLWNMEAESDPAEGGAAGMKNEYEESYDDPGSDDGDSESDLPTNLSMNKRSTDSDLNDYSNNISMPKRVPDTESFNYTTTNKPNTKGSTMLSERQPIITSVQSLNPRLSPPLALSNNPNLTASTLGNNGRKIPLFPQGIQLSELTAAGLLQAPHLPAEVLAQLGYTTLLAQAQAHHQQQQQQQQQSNASTTSQLPHHAQQKIFTSITTSNLSPHPQILNSHTTSHSLPTAVVSAMTGPPRFSYVLPPESQAPINSLVGYQLRPTGGNSAPLSPAASEMMPENLSLHDKHS